MNGKQGLTRSPKREAQGYQMANVRRRVRHQMHRIRERCFGAAPTAQEISRGIRPYLLRHIARDRMHRLRQTASRMFRFHFLSAAD